MKQEKIKWKQIAIRAGLLAAVLLCVWIVSRYSTDSGQEASEQGGVESAQEMSEPGMPGEPNGGVESAPEISEPGIPDAAQDSQIAVIYHFRSDAELNQHFEKHGGEFDYLTPEEYEAGANRVIADERALHKLEKEDGDDVYYLEETNEFVVVSQKGVIRTYFKPSAGKAYYERQ